MQGIEDAADRLVQAPAQEKLRRIAQLCIALSLYIGDIVSTMQIGVVLTLLERTIASIASSATTLPLDCVIEVLQGLEGQYIRYCQLYCAFEGELHYSPLSPNALAFNNFVKCDFATASMEIGVAALIARQMRIALNGIDVGSLANFSRLVWISPVIGSFTGDAWLKQIVSSLTLSSKGLQNSEHELTDFYWVTVLPMTVIENLVSGTAASIAFLPQFQVNPCSTLATAVSKTCHWLRRGHIDPLTPLGAMYWRPCIASARSGLKVPSGKGGQEHWHNCAYVASSYCGVITGGEDGNWQLTAAEVDWSFSFDLGVNARQLANAYLADCYSGTAHWAMHKHLVFPVALSHIQGVPALCTINHNDEEEPIAPHIEAASTEIVQHHGQDCDTIVYRRTLSGMMTLARNSLYSLDCSIIRWLRKSE
ncbi:unnamed protein product [Symbiodinium sp. KB8]|nr:unnamed protein product [Symbiodinium sp. KB8]